MAKWPWPYRARNRQPREIEEHVVSEKRPVLYIVACGGRPAAQLERLVRFAQDDGWDACVILTPDAVKFADMAPLAELTGYPVRVQYKHPDEPDVLPPADAFVVAPATFNTFNKMAAGASDTLALGLLNEGIGAGLPIIAVPWPNADLARHPAFVRSATLLREWGVTVLLDSSRLPRASPQPAVFPWEEIQDELVKLRARLKERYNQDSPASPPESN
jgi:hypothetical protein